MALTLKHADLIRTANFIAGRWQAPAGPTLAVTDPATGAVIATVPDSGAAEARAAVDAAQRREESRGAHTREDHPETRPEFAHRIVYV